MKLFAMKMKNFVMGLLKGGLKLQETQEKDQDFGFGHKGPNIHHPVQE